MTWLFDALAHPTVSGDWLRRGPLAGFAALDTELSQSGVARACAIGLDGVGNYDHAAFAEQCLRYPRLAPVAAYNPLADASVQRMRSLRAMGYVGIKIHPRFSRLTHRLGTLGPVLRWAGEAGLVVFLCTYVHSRWGQYPTTDPFLDFVHSLRKAPETRVVLVHGGDVQLLRYAELVRFNANLLLDLSMTLMKYPGSSIDADLGFLFRCFDRRICIGSDWPEYPLAHVRSRFEALTTGCPPDKVANAAGLNLARFLGLDLENEH